MKGILINDDGFVIRAGGFAVGEAIEQESAVILQMNAGDCREDVLIGPGLISKMHSNDLSGIKRAVELSFRRDNKELLNFKADGGKIKANVQEI